ncbi:MAG: hypothetical protein R2854_18905 [Caldilineaceae bacterium]
MVAQVDGCYADVYAWDNLFTWPIARRRVGVVAARPRCLSSLEDNLIDLQDDPAAETYRPGEYVNFTIHEPKRRLISAALRDRVVHHALLQRHRTV